MAGFTAGRFPWRKFGAVAAWFFFGIVILEVVARLAGFVAIAPSDERNRVKGEDAARLRILTIGESTTADFFAGSPGAAWPRLLEGKLRKAGINARVYNEGRSGTSTPLIAYRLPEYLEKYRPQIVVAMMGVNDGSTMQFTGYERSWWTRALSEIRLLKMASWIFDRVERIGLCDIDYSEFDSRVHAGVLDVAHRMASQGEEISKVESEIRRLAKTDDPKTIAIILTALAGQLNQAIAPGKRPSPGLTYAERAFTLFPLNNRVASAYLSLTADEKKGREASRKLLECGKNLPDNLLGQISIFAAGDESLAAIMRARSLSPAEPAQSDITRRNYLEIYRLLRESGISLVAMQYPTLPLEHLKANFSEAMGESLPGIVFVSNQENFERLLKSYKYEDVFSDRFGGGWGHTTDLGHHAIADSAMSGIMSILAK